MLASYLKIKNVPEFSQANSSLPRYVQGSHQWCWKQGCKWCKCNTKSFELLNIRAKSLKILAKYMNTWTTSLKIRAKMAPNVIWIQKMAPNVCRKTHEDVFFGSSHQKRFSWSLWEQICWQQSHKNLSGIFLEVRAKILWIPNNCLLIHLCMGAIRGVRIVCHVPPTFFLLFIDFNTKSDVSKRRIRDTSCPIAISERSAGSTPRGANVRRRCLLITVPQVISRFVKIDLNNLLQLLANTWNSKWFSYFFTMFVTIFEVNITA